MAQIAWTPKALGDIQSIVAYLEKDSRTRALEIADRLMDAPNNLRHSPRLGRVVPEFKSDFIRELVFVRPYRIIYLIRGNTCHIVRVIHSRRDLRKAIRMNDFEDLD